MKTSLQLDIESLARKLAAIYISHRMRITPLSAMRYLLDGGPAGAYWLTLARKITTDAEATMNIPQVSHLWPSKLPEKY